MMETVAWASRSPRINNIVSHKRNETFTVPLVRLSDAEARIAGLERKAAMLEASAGFAIDDVNRAIARAEAAEALLKEAREATTRLLSRDPEETDDIIVYAFRRGVRAAARAIHHKIGVKDE